MKYKITVTSAIKRREPDYYTEGCDPSAVEESHRDHVLDGNPFDCIADAMTMLVRRAVSGEQIYAFDPNIYCDIKSPPGFRVVRDNEALGQFRVEHDCQETDWGALPNRNQIAAWQRNEIKLWHATYELYFRVHVVGCSTEVLASLIGVRKEP